MNGPPTQSPACAFSACNKTFGVAGAASFFTSRHFVAGVPLDRGDDVAHTITPASTKVEGSTFSAVDVYKRQVKKNLKTL